LDYLRSTRATGPGSMAADGSSSKRGTLHGRSMGLFMKGDKVIVLDYHRRAGSEIVSHVIRDVRRKKTVYVITIAGESGSGKSETAQAVADDLAKLGIKSVLLGQDDYFVLPPKPNDLKRREDPEWLGPHIEVKLDVLEHNLASAIRGQREIVKPLVDYDSNTIGDETVNLDGIKVLIVEGTYTSLLKHVDTRVFICRDWLDTLEHRQKRKRGNEVGDPFIEQVLSIEHKIIAGHRQLADILITKDYAVVFVD
jgi:uridine kinase